MTIKWVDIEENSNYQVNNNGEVRNKKSSHILKPQEISDGYYAVYILIDGKQRWLYVHRLVAKAFLPQSGPYVNHKDGNIKNNFIWLNDDGSVNVEKSNLEWCDSHYNIIDGIIRNNNLNITVEEYPQWKEEERRKKRKENYQQNKEYRKQYYLKNREKILAKYHEKKG